MSHEEGESMAKFSAEQVAGAVDDVVQCRRRSDVALTEQAMRTLEEVIAHADTEASAKGLVAVATATEWRAYDTTSEWSGAIYPSLSAAQESATAHNEGCARRGGYGRAIVVTHADGRLVDTDGRYVWPPHGRSTGAARWVG